MDGKKITVSVDGTETTYDVSDDAKFPGGKNKPGTLKSFGERRSTRPVTRAYKVISPPTRTTKR